MAVLAAGLVLAAGVPSGASAASSIIATATWTAGNGHTYVLVQFSSDIGVDRTWDAARAEIRSLLGPGFDLATITSAEEEQFVRDLLGGRGWEWWVGGVQTPITETNPSAGWTWVTGEPFSYTNWCFGEPNDGGRSAGEQHLALEFGGTCWNDEGSALAAVGGFIAEEVDSEVPSAVNGVLKIRGLPAPGVTATLIDTQTNQKVATTTDAGGDFAFDSTPPGTYALRLSPVRLTRVGYIAGQLRIGEDPVAGATVQLWLRGATHPLETSTQPDGIFVFRGARKGVHEVRFPGFEVPAPDGIPNPILTVTGTEDYVNAFGDPYTRYLLSVLNWQAYPPAMFEPAPDLPPCGLNTSASRTWVDIFTQSGQYLYGFCALAEPLHLTRIWFGIPSGDAPPPGVYITLTDRRTGIVYTSNVASTDISGF